ncbi:MAG: hypothetical protein WCV50_06440 [Patescibacteria group bacterium]|jgi:hypothetical protein
MHLFLKRTVCLLAVWLFLLPALLSAQSRGDYDRDRRSTRLVDLTFGLLTNRGYEASHVSTGTAAGTALKYEQTGGFEAMLTIRQHIFSLGGYLRNCSAANSQRIVLDDYSGGNWQEIAMGQTQLGLAAMVATEFFQPSSSYPWFWLKLRMGGTADPFGRTVRLRQSLDDYSGFEDNSLGVWREHTFFIDGLVTLQDANRSQFGIFSAGLRLTRYINSWSPKNKSAAFSLEPSSSWGLALLFNLSI